MSASSNCKAVLNYAKILDLFEVIVDGTVAADSGLAGKPSPETFLKAAEQLGVEPKRAVVVEDAISGVQAGRSGGFGLVIGVARKENAQALKENGADIVVKSLDKFYCDEKQKTDIERPILNEKNNDLPRQYLWSEE